MKREAFEWMKGSFIMLCISGAGLTFAYRDIKLYGVSGVTWMWILMTIVFLSSGIYCYINFIKTNWFSKPFESKAFSFQMTEEELEEWIQENKSKKTM